MRQNPNSSILRICPGCGADSFASNSEKSFECISCGMNLFINTAAAVAAIITDTSDRLLIAIRKENPAKGTWDLPGGFVDPGETAEQALARELKEELNLDASGFKYFGTFPNTYIFKDLKYSTLDIVFICKIESFKNIMASDDVESFYFCSLDELDPDRFGLESMKNITASFLSNYSK